MLTLGFVLTLAWPCFAGHADALAGARILVLNSWDKDFAWSASVERGMRDGLENSAKEYELHIEYLDADRFPAASQQEVFLGYLQDKYRSIAIDVILAKGLPAADFLSRHKHLFPGAGRIILAPGGKLRQQEKKAEEREIVIPVNADYGGSIKEMLRLVAPQKLYVICDTLSHGGDMRLLAFKTALALVAPVQEAEFLTNRPMAELLRTVSTLPRGSAIFYLAIFQDGDGKHFDPVATSKRISERANSPMFANWSTLLDNGVVGGYMMSAERVGNAAAKAIEALVAGDGAAAPASQDAVDGYFYDWRQLQRWGIDKGRLPSDATIMFFEPTVFDRYKWEIITTSFLLLLLTLISCVLAVVNAKRRAAQLALLHERRLLESRVEERTRELLDLYNNSPNGYHSLAPDGTYLRINDTELKWLGYEREEIVGRKKFTELITAAGRETFRINFPIFVERGWVSDIRVDMVRKDGSILPILLNGTAIKDEHGKFLKTRTTIYDLSEKLRIESQLQDAQRIAHLGSWEIDLISNALIWSDEMFRIYAVPPESAISREAYRDAIHPEDRALTELAFTSSVNNKRPFEITHRVLCADGELKYVRVLGETEFADNGAPLRSSGTAQDVSISMLQKQALRESEERYRTVVEDQTELIARFRADGTIIFVNEVCARLFGKKISDMVGRKWHPEAHPDDISYIEAQLHTLAPGHPVVVIEYRVVAVSGEVRWMQFVNRGFFLADGSLMEIQSVGRDVTERKKLEATLCEASQSLEKRVSERTAQLRRLAVQATLFEERERQAVARDLHDDIGQILHVSKIKLDELSKTVSCSVLPGINELNSLNADASRRVRSLTSQLSSPILRDLGFAPALRWLCEEMERNYGLDIEAHIEDPPVTLSSAQSAILFRAARELLINVAKHADADLTTVDLSSRGGVLELAVEDDGIGIVGPTQAHINNSGFGLASIRERILFLGGSMELRAVEKGGVRVLLQLPLTADARTLAEACA